MQKKRRVLSALAIASAVLFFAATCLIFADLFFDKGDATEIEIPDYRGMLESEIAPTDKIELEISYVFSDKAESGRVISQSKKGKVKVPRGEKSGVILTVSIGKETAKLPDLRGLDIYEASAIIRGMGCAVKTRFSESDSRPDSVLFSIPEADTELAAGEEVILYVATRRAPVTVTVPDFYGCSLNNLERRVKESGLDLGKIEFIYGEDFLSDTVIYQSIGEGCIVGAGESVDFYVARAPE